MNHAHAIILSGTTAAEAAKTRCAFSLIEVLMAVLILSLGLLGLGAIMPAVVKQQRIGADQTHGTLAARSVGAIIKGNALFNKVNPSGLTVNTNINIRYYNRWEAWARCLAEQGYTYAIPSDGSWLVMQVEANPNGSGTARAVIGPLAGPQIGAENQAFINLSDRLVPSPASVTAVAGVISDPQFVVDLAVRRMTPIIAADQLVGTPPTLKYERPGNFTVQMALITRRVDARIRPPAGVSVMQALSDVGGAQANRRWPLSEDANGNPLGDGTLSGSGSPRYSLPYSVNVTYAPSPADPTSYERLVVDSAQASSLPGGGTNRTAATAFQQAAADGQIIIDNLGTVYNVVGADAVGGRRSAHLAPHQQERTRLVGDRPAPPAPDPRLPAAARIDQRHHGEPMSTTHPLPAATRNAGLVRQGFTLTEMLVAVGALALLALGVAEVFSLTTRTVAAGRRLSNLNAVASATERQMRADFAAMTSRGPMVIRNQVANNGQKVDGYAGDPNGRCASDRRDRVLCHRALCEPAAARDRRRRPRRRQRRDDLLRARRPPGLNRRRRVGVHQPRQRRRHQRRGSGAGSQYRRGRFEGQSLRRRVDARPPCVRARSAFSAAQRARVVPGGQGFGAGTARDSFAQINGLPAAPSPSWEDSRLWNGPSQTNPRLRSGQTPALSSGVVDIIAMDLRSVEAQLSYAANNAGFNNLGDAGGLPPTANQVPIGAAGAASAARQQAWMRTLLPADSDNGRRIRVETTAPDFLNMNGGAPNGVSRSDQLMLASGAFLPRCSEFIVEYSFGAASSPSATGPTPSRRVPLPGRQASATSTGTG
ncbi:MAG: prepilin-type N-terminal cleavage/methylation domain-containing protein [Phycisphaerales bacterium]